MTHPTDNTPTSAPLFSVITVARNALPALKATISGSDAQDFDSMELIVVDGASTDGTADYLRQLSCCHRLTWISEPDRGIYDAMNKGVRMAQGRYCIFMNAADRFAAPDVLSRVAAMGMDADVVYGDIMKDDRLKPALTPRNSHRMYYCHQAAFTLRTLLLLYPFDISHPLSADFKQAKQLYLANHTFRHIDIAIADFDTNGISNTRRSAGLKDNISVVNEVDTLPWRLRLLPRLWFTYLSCLLRGK